MVSSTEPTRYTILSTHLAVAHLGVVACIAEKDALQLGLVDGARGTGAQIRPRAMEVLKKGKNRYCQCLAGSTRAHLDNLDAQLLVVLAPLLAEALLPLLCPVHVLRLEVLVRQREPQLEFKLQINEKNVAKKWRKKGEIFLP